MNALFKALTPLPSAARALVVGYSGGLDSTALLHALRDAHPDTPLRAIHVCHHLQPPVKDWAARCETHCRDHDIAFTCLDVRVDTTGRSMEAAARDARYAAISASLAAGEILTTAHHAEDQAETFLLQALRGAGVAGLAAMPEYAALGAQGHWRPWLGIERDAIREYANGLGLNWIEDPSNRNPAIDRGYMRTAIWPALTERWPAAARTLARSAAWAAQASAAIDVLADRDLRAIARADGAFDLRAAASLNTARRAQAVRRWLAEAGLDRPDHRHLDQILALGEARLRASPCVAFGHTEVRLFDDCLYAMNGLPAVPDAVLSWAGQRTLRLPGGAGTLSLEGGRGAPFVLSVCFRAGGERIETPHGAHRRLKDVLREARLAPWVRDRMPLIYADETLVAIADRWRHPALDRLLGCDGIRFVWRHALAGDSGSHCR